VAKRSPTRAEEIASLRRDPDQRCSVKLVANLYAHAKKGTDEEGFLYEILLRRCVEESLARRHAPAHAPGHE